jgi:hypothetical protein
MDTRDNKWFSQLQIPGVAKPVNRNGSIMSIVGETLKDLMAANPRGLKDGECEIILRFGRVPFGDEKASNTIADIAADIWNQLGDIPVTPDPSPDETAEQYYNRLMATGISPMSAAMQTADWFDLPEPEGLNAWMTDSKAQRFRQLNSSQSAFESALPQEYQQLKQYVLATYPQFTESLTFRTA